jgi:hypothetical protein
VQTDDHALDRFGIDRVLGGDRHASHRLTQRWTGQLGANRRSGCERWSSLSAPRVVGAGSFPRSFLILGTDTSIRIGGS